jgi:hypothetical protein
LRSTSAAHAIVSADSVGAAGGSAIVDIATLKNVTGLGLASLVANRNLILYPSATS